MLSYSPTASNFDVANHTSAALSFSESNRLRQRARQIIPGGCHSYAKRDDQYPRLSPGFICRGEGCRVLDVDGNEFMEFGMGLGSVTLGHGQKRVARAAYMATLQGNNFLKPAAIEIQLAEELLALLPYGDMIKFGKNGSDVTAAAVQLARAYTGRELIITPSGYPAGPVQTGAVADGSVVTAHFKYNDINSVKNLFHRYPDKIAAVMMEPARFTSPKDNFLHKVKALCHAEGALFILDEINTGFRWHIKGAQHFYNVEADLSTFGKGLANGFPLSALIGKREFMEWGGLFPNRERMHLLSHTFGAETGALAAALETIRIYREKKVVKYLWEAGTMLQQGVTRVISELDLDSSFALKGYPCCLSYVAKDNEGNRSEAFRKLFIQETIKQGLLMPSFTVSYAHTENDIKFALKGIKEALLTYKEALQGDVDAYLEEPMVKFNGC